MPEITLSALALCLAPIGLVVWLAHRWAGAAWEITYATLRMGIQLLAVGFVLVFLFAEPSPWLGLAVTVVMVSVSAWIGVRTVSHGRGGALWRAVVAIGLGGGIVLVFVVGAVLQLRDPWYQPRLVIPIAGMIFANAMTALTLAAERLEREQSDGLDYPAARRAAWTAAMIPQVNALLAVGLVSLPGMMTGQILAGVDPLVAVRYQIVVMAMILQASAFAVAIFLQLSRGRPNS